MQRTMLIVFVVAALLPAGIALARDGEKPSVAFLHFGSHPLSSLSEKGILDMLAAYGYIGVDERAGWRQGEDFEGADIDILYRSAGFDLATVNLMVEDVLDRGADVLVTITTQVSQIAANATRDLDDPPLIIFSLVATPYDAGIADAPCIKPDHVAGTQSVVSFDDMVPLLLTLDPDMKAVGTLVSPGQQTSVYGARQIKEIGESLGLRVESATVVSIADLNIAVESLAGKGVEAIMYPIGSVTIAGFPVLMSLSIEYGIPLFTPVMPAVYQGVTVGAGFRSFYGEGIIAGRMLVAHLNGDIDLADIRINESRAFGVALNLDSAKEQGVEISDELLAMAEYVIEDGQSTEGVTPDMPEVVTDLPAMPLDARREADLAFLAELHCTDEMIAEQQAQLGNQ
ncbi:MAG: ABC transporter substrate-binding protein [Chloroflexota bacterium]|nr:ABC transporter substrate-binding protein [Chloroflexota bacterium]